MQALRGLHLPLWNPYEGLGMPLFAQMIHGVLHPVGMVEALIAPHASLDLLIIVDIVMAASGAALLAHCLGASLPGAGVAGFAYALSGYVLSMSANLVYLLGAATAPWTVAALRAAAERGGSRIALGAVTVAAAWFAGEPQWAIVAMIFGGAFAAEAKGWRGLFRAAAAVAIGTALAAVQSRSYSGVARQHHASLQTGRGRTASVGVVTMASDRVCGSWILLRASRHRISVTHLQGVGR